MVAGLTSIGLDVVDGCAPFVLFTVPDAELMRKHLDGQGHCRAALRHLRRLGRAVPARRGAARTGRSLVEAIAESPMSGLRDERRACLADVIDVLDAAYPPRLAQDWDSVGLVCGDPAEHVESVTVAVDATAAVVAEVPDGGLLLAHHPLLLRGVDTVAASTAKGALLHRLIRSGGALFTAHTNADSASPGVSDALAEALGLTVEEVLAPVSVGADLDKWVVFVPAENADAVREAMFAAGAGHIGDYSHCSWSVSGHRPVPAARRRIADDRQRRLRRAGSRGSRRGHRAAAAARAHVLAAMRAAHPYEEPAFDVFALAPLPGDVGIGPRRRRCRARSRCRPSSPAYTMRCPARRGACGRRATPTRRCRGWRCAGERATRCSTRSRTRACRPTSPPTCGTIPPTSTGARRTSRWSTSRIGPASSRGAPGGRPAARPFRRLAAGAGVGRPHRSVECREKRDYES